MCEGRIIIEKEVYDKSLISRYFLFNCTILGRFKMLIRSY